MARKNNAQRDAIPSSANSLRVIGRGSCGTVFEAPGSEIAYKKGSDTKALWNDYHLTNCMAASLIEAKLYLEQEEFANVRVFPRTPRCRSFLLHTD